MCSFVELLHEVPRVLEVLSPTGVKSLSATCRSLRTLFCEGVKVIYLSDPTDASKLCCMTWPQLVMVVCSGESKLSCKLAPQWEYMVEYMVEYRVELQLPSRTAVLVRPCQQLQNSLVGPGTQHCAALSKFADRFRTEAFMVSGMTLRGPCVGCRVVQCLTLAPWPVVKYLKVEDSPQLGLQSLSDLCNSLPHLTDIDLADCFLDATLLLKFGFKRPQLWCLRLSNNQLDLNAIAALAHACPRIVHLSLELNMLDAAGMQRLVSCSYAWLALTHLTLRHACIDGPGLNCLAQGHWPELLVLDLCGNHVETKCLVSYLTRRSWPLLQTLVLSVQDLNEEACSLLGIPIPERCSGFERQHSQYHASWCCNSDLPQLRHLAIICGI